MNKNDKTIVELKRKIEEKKSELKATERFSPITNCTLDLDGVHYNIGVLSKEIIFPLIVKLNAYRLSAKDLELEGEISGYKLEDWIKDLRARLMIINRRAEQLRLEQMEKRLHDLLSVETKIGLEIEEIGKSL